MMIIHPVWTEKCARRLECGPKSARRVANVDQKVRALFLPKALFAAIQMVF